MVNLPINFVEGGKCFVEVTSFETTNSVFNTTDENKSFSITTLGFWFSRGRAETINRLEQILKLRTEYDIELLVGEVRKKRNQMKIGDEEYKISDLDTDKNQITEVLKMVELDDFEDMVL